MQQHEAVASDSACAAAALYHLQLLRAVACHPVPVLARRHVASASVALVTECELGDELQQYTTRQLLLLIQRALPHAGLERHPVTELHEGVEHMGAETFRRFVRFSTSAFNELCEELEQQQAGDVSEGRLDLEHAHVRLSLREQLFLCLYRLAHGVLEDELAGLTGVSQPTISRMLDRVLARLRRVLRREVSWPQPEERAHLSGSVVGFPNAIGFVDGTVQEIEKPQTGSAQYYRKDKGLYCLIHLVWCDWRGRIIALDCGWPGGRNDRGVLNECETGTNLLGGRLTSGDQFIIADGGFKGRGPLVIPYTRPAIVQADGPEQRHRLEAFNTMLSHARAVNEMLMARIKVTWKLLQKPWIGGDLRRASRWFKAAARLTNRLMRVEDSYLRNEELYHRHMPELWEQERFRILGQGVQARATVQEYELNRAMVGVRQFQEEQMARLLRGKRVTHR